jgi:hypothetical protein
MKKASSKKSKAPNCNFSYFINFFAKSSGTSAGRFATGTFALE